MNCPNCKAYNPGSANYCSQCGATLTVPQGEVRGSQDQGSGQPESPYGPYLPTPAAEPAVRLTPRSLGQLISETFAVYRRSFGVLWRIAVVGQVPLFVADFISNDALVASLFLASLFIGLLASAATTYAVSCQYLGWRITAGGCYVAALNNGISLLLNSLVFVAALFVGVILSLILIGIPLLVFVLVAGVFYVQAVMIEGKGPMAALWRSWELVRGSWWRVLGIGVAFVVVLVAATFIASVPGLILGLANDTAGNVLTTVGGILATPIGYIGATLVYFDLRVRKEGYTLEALSSELG